MNRPNVLWIMVDQMNAECLSAAGHPVVRTPHLDALARRGVRFSNAYCNYPQCTPSRISMLYGQYLKNTRQYGFHGRMGGEKTHLFDHFKANGYRTGAFGKLHIEPLGPHFEADDCAPSMSLDWFMARPQGNHYGAYLEEHGLRYPTCETHGCPQPIVTSPGKKEWISDIPYEHNLEKWTADRTIDFIRDCAAGKTPFFAFMSFERPHKPVEVPAEMADRIDPDSIELDIPETAEQLLRLPRICLEGRIDPCSDTWRTPESFRRLLACYFTIIELIDDQIGRVVKTLDELGLADSTHITFVADHGDQAGVKRIFDKCQHASSNQLTKIPFILAPVKGAMNKDVRGRVAEEPVEAVDLFPTFCAWARLSAPDGMDGRSLTGFFRGELLDPHRTVFMESYFRRAVVTDGWKLVHHVGCSVGELYDLNSDPKEYENLYLQPGHAAKVEELKHELIRFYAPPWTEKDTRHLDETLMKDREMLDGNRNQAIHRAGCESGPFFMEARGVLGLEYKRRRLFYRVDNRRHVILNPQGQDIYGTPMGRFMFGELRDRLLDELIRRIPTVTYTEPEPQGSELPTPEQVEAFLSQPLYRDQAGLERTMEQDK